MNLWRLVQKSIRFYWRTSSAVLAAVVLSTAVLVGALAVGDSVRYSLARLVDDRLGGVNSAVIGQDRFFTSELAGKLSSESAAVFWLNGIAANEDGSKRINKANVLGVDGEFFKIGRAENTYDIQAGEAVVNDVIAEKLGVKVGDEVLLRIAKPSLMPRDVVLVPGSDVSMAFRVKIAAVATTGDFGRFGLSAEQVPPVNVFVDRQWLAEKTEQPGRANLLLSEGTGQQLQKDLDGNFSLSDIGIEIEHKEKETLIVKSKRVFIESALEKAFPEEAVKRKVFTYFVNEIRLGDKSTPYSMVSAVANRSNVQAEDSVIINQWLADDLEAKVGDRVELKYYVPEAGGGLIEKSSWFTVSMVVPYFVGESLLPDFPGLVDEENCRDWDPGIPIDLDRIRDKDEVYWDEYGPMPKAVISLKAGQRMWANRFGSLTAVELSTQNKSAVEIGKELLAGLDAKEVGLYFQDVRGRGVDASKQGTDFGGLFIGLSMFLIAAAVVLISLVFVFGVERRLSQVGIMLSVGITGGRVKRVLLLEAGVTVLFGVVIGSVAGLLYTKVMIWALSTVWAGAIASAQINFYVTLKTIAIGGAASFVISMLVIVVSLGKHLRLQISDLLKGICQRFSKASHNADATLKIIRAAAILGAVFLMFRYGKDKDAAMYFFAAGGLTLLSALLQKAVLLKGYKVKWSKQVNTLRGVAIKNSHTRVSRSMAVVTMMAIGSFLVISVGANRKDVSSNATDRESGTGGFAMIAESTMPIVESFEQPGVVRFRVSEGDDASCLNLNRAQKPVLLGVDTNELDDRSAFGFQKAIEGQAADWSVLDCDLGDGVVPAVGDSATIVWGLGKAVGDEIEFVDEQGNQFKVVIAGMINNSVLQGKLIVSEKNFVEKFPSVQGYNQFLIDVEQQGIEEVSGSLSRKYRDYGFQVQRTTGKLAEFGMIENTYLSIFQILGGLAMMIGSVGLGVVVLINVLDRRGELAMMRAMGFDKAKLKHMIMLEHLGLLGSGLGIGVLSAIIAVLPALLSGGANVPVVSLLVTIFAILVSGVVWIWAASTVALSGKLIEALRLE